MTLLSKPAIKRHMAEGNLIIDPFDPDNLGPNSYDVTLGKHFWRERFPESDTEFGMGHLYNPYSKPDVERLWVPEVATKAKKVFFDIVPCGINQDDHIILISPGESILAHTQEFIGGCGPNITTTMFARSSAGRNFLEVCRCAGQGDIGYHTRWTLEVTNNSMHYTIPLVVGRRYAQIEFFEVEPLQEDGYSASGKYQTSADLEELKANWKPEMMLPRMYNDKEVTGA